MRTTARPMRLLAVVSLLAVAIFAAAPLSNAQEAAVEEAKNDLDELQGDLGETVDRYNELQAELEDIHARRSVIEVEVERIARDMLGLEDRAVRLAQELYKGGGIA